MRILTLEIQREDTAETALTYAMKEGYLGQYFMLGIQENYTSENIWQRIEDE